MLRFIRTREEQKKILRACHVDQTSGHMGEKKTINRITERFMWNGIVKEMVSDRRGIHIFLNLCIIIMVFFTGVIM